MGNKPKETYYSEFRNFAEWQRKGKSRIKREHLPGIGAWLIMLANRYEKAAEGLEAKLVKATVPGMKEAAARMRYAVEHIRMLVTELPNNFDHTDWMVAVNQVCEVLKIERGAGPIVDVGEDPFSPLVPVIPDGGNESGTGSDVQPSSAGDPGGTRPDGKRARKRR